MLKGKKVVIFDMDGTLIDSVGIWNEIDIELIKQISSVKIDFDELNRIQEIRDGKLKEYSKCKDAYLEYCGYLKEKYKSNLTKQEIHDLRYKIAEDFLKYKIDYKENAENLIKKLKDAGYILVIASTTKGKNMEIYKNENKNIKNKADINQYFSLILLKEDVSELKPNPEVYLKVLDLLNVQPEECLIFEDSLIGVQAANASGIDVAVIYDKYSDGNRKEINRLCQYHFDNYMDVINYILIQKAKEIRKGIIEAVYQAQSGHPGGSLSIADILTVLYFHEMHIDPQNPNWEERDRFVLSKGHCAPALYATLANRGFFDVEDLKTFRHIDSYLQGHPDRKHIPGVDMTTGSLGQGLSAANGMAIAAKLDHKSYRVYCVLGDGEIEEGQIWEAAMTANKYHLDNLCVIVDNNQLQIDGKIEEVMSPYPVDEKFKSFGFEIIKIDGHDIQEIINAFEVARNIKGKPTCIIASTIKGKGVSFMENQVGWHGKAPNEEQYKQAMQELSK